MANFPIRMELLAAHVVDDDRRALWDRNSQWWTNEYIPRADSDYQDVILPILKDVLQGQEKVIDIGGGEGRVSRYLIEENDCEAVCVDFSVSQLCAAHAKGQGPSFVQANVGSLPFRDGAFDGAVACLVLEHVLELTEALDEANRVLRAEGKFVLVLNHPVIQTPDSGFIHDHVADPPTKYWRISEYLIETSYFEEVEKGIFLPYEHRSLSKYINSLVDAGFTIQRLYEPSHSDSFIAKNPEFSSIRSIPRLLIIICTS